ncbi:MAG: hypothetical protein JXR69_00205 [Candidatus Delongbacteria bacterium]|nr:hypothetical protein [Candidatus Delongbacteria bacterium]
MKKYSIILKILTVVMFFVILSCGENTGNKDNIKNVKNNLDAANLHKIKTAVDVVEMTLGSMQDSGYEEWTPKKAVDKLIPTLNSALTPFPGESGNKVEDPLIKYVKDNATDLYQVVLIPDNEKRLIYIKGYGKDLKEPVYAKEIKVSKY